MESDFVRGVNLWLAVIKDMYPVDPIKIKMQARQLTVGQVSHWWSEWLSRRDAAAIRQGIDVAVERQPIRGLSLTPDQVHAATILYLHEQEPILAMWRL